MVVTDLPDAGTSRAPVNVDVRGLHVRFRVFEEQRLAIRDLLHRRFRSRRSTEVHALRGVDLTIRAGESVGLVGSNGSGKSTLLRCIAGVQRPDQGAVLVRGRAQLLAVGAALNRQLSGERNIWLGGLAMGLTPDQVQERVASVSEFSGLGDALRRPIETYSSGMRARLAFSIATMMTPDILLIDEALAVGDRQFRRRSLERVREICAEAHTVIMVTHNLNEIRQTCHRTVWLADGAVVADGPTDAVLEEYEATG